MRAHESTFDEKSKSRLRIAALAFVALAWNHANGATSIEGMDSRPAPTPQAQSRPAVSKATLSLPLDLSVKLPPFSADEEAAKTFRANNDSRVGLGRSPRSNGTAYRVELGANARAGRLSVASPGARHLRTGLVLPNDADYVVTVWATTDPENGVVVTRLASDGPTQGILWTGLTDGPTQEILVQRDEKASSAWNIQVEQVSHLADSITESTAKMNEKAFGDSAPCQFDIACIVDAFTTASQKAAVLAASRAVAKIITTDSLGNSYACTGTLLNTASYPLLVFLTAYHCVENATSLISIWQYTRTTCNAGGPGPYVQLTGGGKTLYRDASLDVALFLLYGEPPSNVIFGGWDPAPVQPATFGLAIHHPEGDVQKGSIGSVAGTNTVTVQVGDQLFAPGVFYLVDMQAGIVEHGSSGSPLLIPNQSGTFRLRATLTGGASTCGAGTNRNYYSQLTNVYPIIAPFLTQVLPITPAVGLWWNPNESGSGYNIDVKHGVLVLTIYSYKPNGDSEWYIATGTLTNTGRSFAGTLSKARGGQCISCTYNGLPVSGGSDGAVSIEFSSPTAGVMKLPGGRTVNIQPQAF